jgi:hypothetical protein
VPRNAKALKCIAAAGEEIAALLYRKLLAVKDAVILCCTIAAAAERCIFYKGSVAANNVAEIAAGIEGGSESPD